MILEGRRVSPGFAHATARLLDPTALLLDALQTKSDAPPGQQVERLRAALARAEVQLQQVRRDLERRGRVTDAEIFAVHATMLSDPVLVSEIEQRIRRDGEPAAAAVAAVALANHQRFASSEHPMIRDKAADVLDIGRRLVQCLRDTGADERSEAMIVVAPMLTPSELVRLAHHGLQGAVLESCSLRSHSAILARGLGIPLIVHDDAMRSIGEGEVLWLDGERALIAAGEGSAELELARSVELELEQARQRPPVAAGPPLTRDGVAISLMLNISDEIEARDARALGADGVGLFRTEFLYMDRAAWPSEADLYQEYEAVTRALGDAPLCLRLADFGADKCPPYADIPVNRNPSLGVRGVRLLLQRDDIFEPQVRAAARLAAGRPLRLLLPMIDSVDTLEEVIGRLREICGLRRGAPLPFSLSAMIEMPAAALLCSEILSRVDALSLGLNDLAQYTLAADRDDELVESYHDALQPAVLRLVAMCVEAGRRLSKPVSVCGELAGDPNLLPALLALGIRTFSVSRSDLSRSRRVFASLSIGELEASRSALLTLDSAAGIRELLAAAASASPDATGTRSR